MEDESTNIINIVGIEEDVVEATLFFIYTGKVGDLRFGFAERLLAAAAKYELDSLEMMCNDWMVAECVGEQEN